jgi:non-heme chloroperoxidase
LSADVRRALLSPRLEVLAAGALTAAHPTPLLFVHGAYAGAWTWAEHFLPFFAAQGFAAYALSLRGHGESDGHDRLAWHSLRDYVDDLAEVVDALPAPPVLVGHSMGAMVIMKYLERATVPGAVFLAPVPPQGLLGPSVALAFARPSLFAELNGLLAHGRASPAAMHEALFAGPVSAERLTRYYARFQRESARAIWDMTWFDLPRGWLMRRPPMLALLAGRDALLPRVHSQTGFAGLAQVDVLDGFGHAMMLESGWERAASRLRDWLGQI